MENNVTVSNNRDMLGIVDAPINMTITPAAREYIDALKKEIDINDRDKVLAFGQVQQESVSAFADKMLSKTKTKELAEASNILVEVITQLEGYNNECKDDSRIVRWVKGFFGKVNEKKIQYETVAKNMDIIIEKLQEKDNNLQQLVIDMEVLHRQSGENFKNLSLAIVAAEEVSKVEEKRINEELAKAENTNDLIKLQELTIMKDNWLRFDRRIHNLRLSRAIALSQAPQIRNIQKSGESISENIKSTIVNTIPIWKAQLSIALGLTDIEEAAQAEELVRDATNKMLVMNSERNKRLSIAAAKAMEKGAVDVETILQINKDTIDTLKECYQIVENGRKERIAAAEKIKKDEEQLAVAIKDYAKNYALSKPKAS